MPLSTNWEAGDAGTTAATIGRRGPRPWTRKRYLVFASMVTLVLAVYAGVLAWTTHRLETDIQKSIHVRSGPIPDRP